MRRQVLRAINTDHENPAERHRLETILWLSHDVARQGFQCSFTYANTPLGVRTLKCDLTCDLKAYLPWRDNDIYISNWCRFMSRDNFVLMSKYS
jgi:hypothetical protein